MANPFLTENEKRNLAIKNNAYNQVLQGFEQPQQEDTTNDDGFLGAAKRAVVGTGASMAGGLGYLLGAEGMADSMQKTAQENARLRDYDSIWNWQYATDPYGLWYDIVSTGTSAAALAPMAAAVPAGATAGLAGLAGRTLAKYGGQKVAQWAASKAGQAALSDMARGAIGSVPEALSEWGNTAQEANAMGMENPRLGTIGTFAGNMAVLPISNALEYSLLKGSLFRPSAKEGETWLQRLYKAPARAVPVVGLEGAQQSTEELLQTTVSDASLGIEVGNPLNPYSWTDRQRQAWEKGLAGSIGLGGGPGVYRATQVQEQQAELDNKKPVQGFDGKYWYENGYQPMSKLQEQSLPFDKETPSFNEKDYEGLEGSIKAEGDSKKFNANDYAALKSIGFIDTLDNDAQQKAIYNAYANGTLSQEQAQQLLSKLNSEAAYALDKGLTQDQYLAEKNGFNAEQLGPSNIDTGKGSTKMPSAFMSKLFEQIMQEELAKQQAAERTRKGIAFAEAMRNTPTGKGAMPEIINQITGDAFSQPFSLGTITKATQNKALGATPSAYTSRKAMATGNAANQAINFPAQAGLNQSNMPIGSAQNLRQQVNAVNLALAANRGATDKTAFQQQPAQQPSDANATADRLMAEQAITNLFDNARLLPPEYYANRDAQQQAQAELAERRKALANILGNVATQKWDETQQEYGNRRQQALQNIANIVNARAAGKWDKLEGANASKQQSVQGIANIVNALAAGRFDKAEADSKANVDAKERQKAAQAIANIVNARAAGMWDSKEAENQAKAEARQAIADIINARAAQQWDNAEKGKQNEKTEQKREAAKNTQGAKAEKKQNAQADKNVKKPKEEKPIEQKPKQEKPVEQKPKEEVPKAENDNKINLPEGVTVEVSYNEEKNGVQLKFNKAPGNDVTSKLFRAGFKWSRKNQLWYSLRNNPKAMEIAKQFEIAKETPKQEETAAPKPSSDSIDLTTEQDKLDFKREEMTEAFGKLLGIDSVMSYDDAVKKFGEDRLNEGQVVLHIPNSKLYFIVEKYNEDDTAKHGMKYHVDAFDSKLDYDVNNIFDAKNENVVAERVRNPKGDNKSLQWQGRTPEDWMLQEVDRTITDWRGEKRTVDNISYSGGQWWATFDNGSTMSMESLEEYNRQLQNLTNNKEKALALTEKPQTQATATTFKDNPESLINEDALSKMSLSELNAINDMFNNGKDRNKAKEIVRQALLNNNGNSKLQTAARNNNLQDFKMVYNKAVDNFMVDNLEKYPFFEKLLNENTFAEKEMGKAAEEAYKLFRAGMEKDNQDVVKSKVEKSTKEVTDNGNNEGRYSEVSGGQVSEGSSRSQEKRNLEQTGTGQLYVGEQQVQRPKTEHPEERPNTEGRNNDGGLPKNPRSGKGSTGTSERGNDVLTPAQKTDAKASEIPGHNYTITEKSLGEGGPKTKYANNVAAIKLLKKLEAENRLATPSEQKILAKYVGWGGLSSVFSINASGNAMDPVWAKEAKEIKELLTPAEYKAARASTNTAFYTPIGVIKNIYKMLDRLGFKHGKILEPSMGTGNFFGVMPNAMREKSALNGVEIDPLTAKIAQQLYQRANIEQTGYEGTKYPDNFFDVVISNVPFGVSLYDPKYAKYNFKSHNYFFAKAMDQVRPGGLVCFVTSTDTMQGSADAKKLRELLRGKADLVAAVRLPNTTFKDNAGTEVTSDIIILQKREQGATPSKNTQAWLETVDSGVRNSWGQPLSINEYYANHPEMLIGELKAGGKWGNLILDGTGVDVEKAMQKLVTKLPKDIYKPRTSTRNTNSIESAKTFLAPSNSREGSLLVHNDGLVYQTNQGKMELLGETAQAKAKDYIQLRDTVKALLQAQVDPQTTDELLDKQRIKLNEAYDNFVKKHGYVNSPRNISSLSIDPDYGIIESIEDYRVDPLDKKKVTAKKRAIFTQRTVNPVIEVTKADNINDALSLSLSNTGNVDLAYMSKLLGGQNEDSIIEELGDRVYNNPTTEGYELAEEYLSGNVREKLEIAEMAAKTNPAYRKNVEALKKVQPKELQQEDVSVGLGTPWIPASDIQQFAADLLNTRRDAVDIKYIPQTGSWVVDWGWVDNNTKKGVENTQTWGTADKSFKELLSHALNQSTPTVSHKDANGNYYIDSKATLAAQAKLKEIQTKFADWIWQDEERTKRLLAYYNRNFNNWVLREYDGSALTFPGYSTAEPALKDHQKNAVWRILQDGTALIAHCVGSGKTWTMQTAAMELKRLGLANKSMFVIPNHMLQQFENEFRRIYPNAKLLTLSNDTLPDVNIPGASKMKPFELKRRRALKNAKRQATLSKVATEDWDGIIISHNLFKRIPMSPTKYNEFYEKQLAELEQALTEAKRESKGKDPATKELEKAKKALETKLKRDIKEEEKDIVIPFEQLGIDQIFVDEADMFKNLYFPTKMTRIAGMSNTNSQRSMDMFIKTQYIQEVNNGRGVVFATGTPISNTMAEMFTMLRYLDMKGLKEKNLGFFDNWASTFATKETATELAPDGSGYRSVEKFTKFNNMPELIKMFRKVADVKKREDLDIKVPNLKNNKPTVVEVPMNSALKTYIEEEASKRANAIHNRQVEPTEDNMLKLTGDLRKASLDIRLVDPTVPASVAGAKVQAVIDHTYDKYVETADKQGVQLIFCDLSTPKGASDKELISDKEDTEEKEEQEDNTNITVYEEIKKGLVKKGIPANQIAFIHDAKTKAAKEQLFERCRRGDIRVLIGSTEKMGAGTNIQNKLVALHHVDAPWRPRDIEQREGRILRQGNENEEVEIFNYVTKGSFDANMWEKIKNKATMIGQAMSGDLTQRTLEDTDATVLSFAEIEALASGNPLMAERVMVNAKLNQYSVLAANYKKDQAKNKRDLETLPKTLKILEEKMQNAKEDIKTRIDTKGDKFSIKIGGITYDSRTEAKEIIERDVKNYLVSNVKLGGFNIKATLYPKGFPFLDNYGKIYTAETDTYRAEVIGKNRYYCDYTVSSMEYTVMNMPEKIYLSAKNGIESTQKRIKAIEAELNKPFKYQEEYEKLQKRSAEIEAELQKMNEGPSVDDVVQQALDLLKEEKTQYSVGQTNDIQYSIAYHGTPHKFNEFDTNRIGSGVGGQIYGWGLYFTEDEAVAQTYRQNLSASEEDGQTLEVEVPDDDVLLDYDLPFSEQPPKVQAALRKAAAGYGRSDMTVDGILDNFRKNIYIVRDLIENKMLKKSYRNVFLYDNFGSDVMELAEAYLNKENIDDIKDSIFENINEQMQYAVEQEMVDDDSAAAEKLSKQLTDEAVKTVKSLIDEESSGSGKIKFSDNMYGEQIYQIIARTVGSDKDASLLLNKYGIKGLTYNGGNEGKCYVLFDAKSIKILRQYMLANNDIIPTRSHAEVEAEIRTAFPNGTIEYTNGVPIVTLPNGVKFQYSIRENIIVNAREQKRANAAHGTSGGVIQGFWQKFSGNGVQRLLAVAQNSERGTAFHEAMHAAIDLALTEKEANALRKHYQNKAKEQNRNVDEVIADAYRDWVLARQQKRGTAFGKLWQKIKDFCVRIRSLFDNGAEVKRIMQDVESGRVYERGTNNGNIKKRVYFSKVEIQGQAGSGTTQIAGTRGMYVKALKWLRGKHQDAKTVLDYGAGLGLGTDDMRLNNPDLNIDSYEPNPERWQGKKPPSYTNNTQINKDYDLILNTNVLNVVEKPIRDLIVKDIASHLNMNGKALITTRGWKGDISTAKNFKPSDEYHGIWIDKGKNGLVFQKGFDGDELKNYIEELLGNDFVVEKTRPTFGKSSVTITRIKPKANTNNAQNVEASQGMPDSYKTLKGSPIKRSKYGVGKLIGGQIYLHKDYALDVIPKDVWEKALKVLADTNSDFEYNCVMYDAKTGNVRFDEAPDFDTAREPVVGNTLTVKPDGTTKAGYSKYIWHHKWIWVKNDYQGFDVNESKAWSQKWLGILTETADGNGIERWNAQLDRFGLEHDGENIQYSVAAPKSKIASAFTNTERKGTIQSVKDFFKEHWKSFYSDYVDKNDVLHAFDVLTNSGLTLYEQVQNLPSTTAGFLKAISEGTEKHIDAANKHLKNVKMKHRVTLAMALDTINKETMDKAHPDYLTQNGFDSWVNAFGAYLGAERLLEMNSIAKAQGEEYKLPNKLTEAELQQFVRNAPMQFKKAADIFYKVNDNMLSVMEDAGVFSHDLAQLLRTKYKKYCPLLRDFSDTAAADSFINGLTTGGRGIGNVSIPLKKISISGSERGVLNPLETVLKSYAVMLNRAERNKVGLMAVNSAKEAGMEDIIEEVPEIIGKNGEVVNAVADPKNCVFTVLVNGKKKAYKTTPELYGPIVGYNMPAAGLVFGVARTAAKMLRTGATMSPSFILRNVLRDTFFAGISSKNGFVPILDTVRGGVALWSDPAMRAEFEAAGVTEFNFYSSQEQRIKSIDAMAGEKPVGPLEMIKWAFSKLEALSDFMESATRMGEFMKARGKGLSIEEAARAAREVTLDFSRSGRVGEQINQVVPFFNACVQGGDKMRRLLREDFRGTATKLFKYIVLPSIFLWAMNYDEDWYKDLDPDIKNNYWCLGKNIRIPKPQEAGVLFGSGFEALLDQANGKDSEAMANWAKAFMSNMTPGIVPTLFLPLLEWQANYSYFKGRPLVSSKYQRLPDELQYNDYTSELSKSIGNNPLYKVSPMKVDNLVRGYTGTMGALLWSLPDYATDKAKNQPARNWYEYTPFRDFTVTDANMSRPLNDFYGMLDAANRQHAGYGVKGKPTQAVQAIRKTGTMISNIRKDIDKITKSKLTAERKRQLIDQRKAKMNKLARQANERYGKYFD